jgi:CPA1 family monovalent cation:H+ antiporter
MAVVEAVLLLIAACIGFALLARRLRCLRGDLVLGGMALAFVPGLPEVPLDPELALAFFTAAALAASAYRTDWRASAARSGPSCAGVAASPSPPPASPPWPSCWCRSCPGAAVALAPSSRRRTRWPPPRCCDGCACRALEDGAGGRELVNDARRWCLPLAVAAVAAGALSPWEGVLSFFTDPANFLTRT